MNEKKLKELLEEYIVLENLNCNSNNKYFITLRDNFETIAGCKTYGNYGQKMSCYDNGCYSIDNCACDFKEDLLEDINETFSTKIVKDDIQDIDDIDDYILLFKEEKKYKDIKKHILEWEKDNTEHYEITAWNYHDGSNWKTITLDASINDVEEVDENIAKEILSELPESPYIEGTSETIETDNHSYFYSRYSDFPWICTVD